MPNTKFTSRITLVLFVSLFCCLSSISMLVRMSTHRTNIRSDGKGYYLYLPSAFIHKDLTMKWTEPLQKTEPPTIDWYGLSKVSNGKYLNKYAVGLAILWLPFFVVAHLLTHLTGGTADGFSIFYQIAIAAAAVLYGSLGCTLLFKTLNRYFTVGVSLATTLTILFATNLLSYIVYDSGFTHVYSFFLVSFILYLLPSWYSKMSYKTTLLLALLLSLCILVRQTNIFVILIVLLGGVKSRTSLNNRLVLFWQQRRKLLLMAVVMLAVASPQLLYWYYITGKWFIFSYRGEGFNFLHPQFINILFSPDRGLFFWAPVLILSLFGLIPLKRKLSEWSIALYVFLPIWLFVTASWHSWQFGESYGHRAFIDIMPILSLPLAFVLNAWRKTRISSLAITVFISICTFINLFLTYQYWLRELLPSGSSLRTYAHTWMLGFHKLIEVGFGFGFLGLLGIISITLSPLTYYYLLNKSRLATRSESQ